MESQFLCGSESCVFDFRLTTLIECKTAIMILHVVSFVLLMPTCVTCETILRIFSVPLSDNYLIFWGSKSSIFLSGGSSSEAMEDFTGGITEFFDLRKNPPKNLFEIMSKAMNRSSLMGCSIEADPNVTEAELPNGLIMGHAYSITDVKLVS